MHWRDADRKKKSCTKVSWQGIKQPRPWCASELPLLNVSLSTDAFPLGKTIQYTGIIFLSCCYNLGLKYIILLLILDGKDILGDQLSLCTTILLRSKVPYLLLFTYNTANVGSSREKKPCMETRSKMNQCRRQKGQNEGRRATEGKSRQRCSQKMTFKKPDAGA